MPQLIAATSVRDDRRAPSRPASLALFAALAVASGCSFGSSAAPVPGIVNSCVSSVDCGSATCVDSACVSAATVPLSLAITIASDPADSAAERFAYTVDGITLNGPDHARSRRARSRGRVRRRRVRGRAGESGRHRVPLRAYGARRSRSTSFPRARRRCRALRSMESRTTTRSASSRRSNTSSTQRRPAWSRTSTRVSPKRSPASHSRTSFHPSSSRRSARRTREAVRCAPTSPTRARSSPRARTPRRTAARSWAASSSSTPAGRPRLRRAPTPTACARRLRDRDLPVSNLATTQADGSFLVRITPGATAYDLVFEGAAASGLPSTRIRVEDIALTGGELVVTLPSITPARYVGTVETFDGQPLAGVSVELTSTSLDAPATSAHFQHETATTSDGSHGTTPGTFDVALVPGPTRSPSDRRPPTRRPRSRRRSSRAPRPTGPRSSAPCSVCRRLPISAGASTRSSANVRPTSRSRRSPARSPAT